MKAYGVNELRKMFLEFFESKGHLAMKSFSLDEAYAYGGEGIRNRSYALPGRQ